MPLQEGYDNNDMGLSVEAQGNSVPEEERNPDFKSALARLLKKRRLKKALKSPVNQELPFNESV